MPAASNDFLGRTARHYRPQFVVDPTRRRRHGTRPEIKESTYQGILRERRIEGVRLNLPHLGGIKFGPPTKETIDALNAIMGIRRLQRLSERVLTASSWQEVLAGP